MVGVKECISEHKRRKKGSFDVALSCQCKGIQKNLWHCLIRVGLSDCAVIGLCGWGEIIHGPKQLQCALLYDADVRSQIWPSAIQLLAAIEGSDTSVFFCTGGVFCALFHTI